MSTSFRFDWHGKTKIAGELAPGEVASLKSSACFSRPGVYNLNRWKLTLYRRNTESLAHSKSQSTTSLGYSPDENAEEKVDIVSIQSPTLPHLVSISHVPGKIFYC